MSSQPRIHWDDSQQDQDDDWGVLIHLPIAREEEVSELPSEDYSLPHDLILTWARRMQEPLFKIPNLQVDISSWANVSQRMAEATASLHTRYLQDTMARFAETISSVGSTSARAVRGAGILMLFAPYLEPSSYQMDLNAWLFNNPDTAYRLFDALETISGVAGVESASISYLEEDDEPPVTIWARLPVDEPNFDDIEEELYSRWFERYAELESSVKLAVI